MDQATIIEILAQKDILEDQKGSMSSWNTLKRAGCEFVYKNTELSYLKSFRNQYDLLIHCQTKFPDIAWVANHQQVYKKKTEIKTGNPAPLPDFNGLFESGMSVHTMHYQVGHKDGKLYAYAYSFYVPGAEYY